MNHNYHTQRQNFLVANISILGGNISNFNAIMQSTNQASS